MATNPFFKDYSGEQDLAEDLTIEIIKTMGRNMYYIPRNVVEFDKIFGEGKRVNYKNAVPVEMYIDSVSGFQGQGDIASKFGIEIKDNVFLTVSKKRFIQEIQTRFPTIIRPREGDLIYFPLSKSLFEINFVEHENPFYQHGKLYSYRLTCELFTYNEENITTGTTDIDAVATENREYSYQFVVGADYSGITLYSFYPGEIVYQVSGITGASALYSNATATAVVSAFSLTSNTVDLINIQGTFNVGASTDSLRGLDSGIEKPLTANNGQTTTLVLKSSENKTPLGDNDELDTEKIKLDIFDFTEKDPFSEGNY
jgi:hypothetical protein